MTRLIALPIAALFAGLHFLMASGASAQESRSTQDLSFFVGRWEGESTFLPAFTEGAEPHPETIQTTCASVLADTYIQCELALTNPQGQSRGVMILWNFNTISSEYEALLLDSKYPQEWTYSIKWDETEKAYVSLAATRTADGRPATERGIFRVSADRNTITGSELIRPDDRPTDPWTQTFEYVWRRVG